MVAVSPVRLVRALSRKSGRWSPRQMGAVVLGLVSALLVVPAPAQANGTPTTRTVCASGCDHTTIQAAINAANSGDTITVAAGTYAETLTINKPLTLVGPQSDVRADTSTARAGGEAVIQPPANGIPIELLAGASGTSISGFTIHASGTARAAIFDDKQDNDSITVENNIITSATHGIERTGYSPKTPVASWVVRGNYIDGTDAAGFTGVFLWYVDSSTLEANVIRDFDRGVQLDNGGYVSQVSSRIAGNLFESNVRRALQIANNPVGATIRIVGNTFRDNNSGSSADNTSVTISNTPYYKYDYSAAIRFRQDSGAARSSENVTISNNFFSGSYGSDIIWGDDGGSVWTPQGATIVANAFSRSSGGSALALVYAGPDTPTVGLSGNYWGPNTTLESVTSSLRLLPTSLNASSSLSRAVWSPLPWVIGYVTGSTPAGFVDGVGFWPEGVQTQAALTRTANQPVVPISVPLPEIGNPVITADFVGTVSVTVEAQDASYVQQVSSGGTAIPFTLDGGKVFTIVFDTSQATFAAPVKICTDGSAPSRLFHFTGGEWVDITTGYEGSRVCGETANFSPFAVGVPKPIVASEEPAPAAPPVQPLLPVVMPSVTVADSTATCTVGEYSRSVSAVDVSLLLDGTVLDTRALASGATSTSWPTEATWAGGTLTCRVFARGENVVSTATSQALTLPGGAPPPPPRDLPKEPLRFFQSVTFALNGTRLSSAARDQVAALVAQGGVDTRYRVVGYRTINEWWRGAKVARPRAQAVADALVAAGVPREQILIRYGGISDLGGVAGRVVRISTLP